MKLFFTGIGWLLFAPTSKSQSSHNYNSSYKNKNLDCIAFPVGGMGAGMFCIEGTGAISHMSVRNNSELFNEPAMFAAIVIKGVKESARVLEGPVPEWKKFGMPNSGMGNTGATWGLRRFESNDFTSRFPFADIKLKDHLFPVQVSLKAWSPFIPTDENNFRPSCWGDRIYF